MTARYTVRTEQTAEQVIDGEAVVINFESYHYYGLNRTATAVWALLRDGGRDADDIARALSTAFDAAATSVTADVRTILELLLAEGLIETTATAALTPATVDATGRYVAPLFEKHGKLDQLMLSGE